MDADKSRPIHRPAAAGGQRPPVRRPRKLAWHDLAPGPQREVRDLLYGLHEKAGLPALEDLEQRIAADDRLEGSPKKDLIHKIISKGGPANLDDVRAVARTLARDCGLDEHAIAAQVGQLTRSIEQPVAPGPLMSPRSAYMAQVRRIAPPQLLGREAELDELSRFCLDDQRSPYIWWRAGPWAGKSALLSTFVLNPPAPVRSRVQVVAFFITARLAAQDTRQAFIAVVAEQLAALTGQQGPAVIDESLREAWLLDQLERTAQSCRQRGQRLVLVVDGLDEDRGVTTGPDAHSIAGLLPADPPAGMRVIVAGRTNPPVPDDVPDWHPLRDPGIIRLLTDSPQARDLRRLGQAELKRLVKGSQTEQDLLGLVTAARGGLSGADLQELTGIGLADIEDVLHTVAGRTFTTRAAQWSGAHTSQVYLLGHEELDAAARRYLGEPRLAGYRDRLHTWADHYRLPSSGRPAWPRGTPEYLLSGYPRMLSTVGDLARLVELVIDPVRHDRMLDLSGGDGAALDEIIACQGLVLAGPQPDLEAMALLSVRLNALIARNDDIPTQLPAIWAACGLPDRAEALASSLTHPRLQEWALAEVASAVAAGRDHDGAERIVGSLAETDGHARALADLAETFRVNGDHERARRVAVDAERSALCLKDPDRQCLVLINLAAVWGRIGDHERATRLSADAEQLARTLPEPVNRGLALAALAQVMAAAGDHDRAKQWAGDAELIAHALAEPYSRARVLTALVETVGTAGDHDRATQLAGDAERLARSSEQEQGRALAALVEAVAVAVDHDRAEQLAHSVADPYWRGRALARLAEVAITADDHALARRAARAITDPYWPALIEGPVARRGEQGETRPGVPNEPDLKTRAKTLTDWAEVVAAAGDHDRAAQLMSVAEQHVRALTEPDLQSLALTKLAQAAVTIGDIDRAQQLAAAAERYARAAADLGMPPPVVAALVGAVAVAGDHSGAEQIARAATAPDHGALALAELAKVVALAGKHDLAKRLAVDAEQHFHVLAGYMDLHGQALAALSAVAVAAGDHDRARKLAADIEQAEQMKRDRIDFALGRPEPPVEPVEAVAGDHSRGEQITPTVTDPYQQVLTLAVQAKAAAAARDHDRAKTLTADAEQLARNITHPHERALALIALVHAAADDHDKAERLATDAEQHIRAQTDRHLQGRALTNLANAVGLPRARRLLAQAFISNEWWVPLPVVARLAPEAVPRIADAVARNHPSRDVV